MNYPDFVCMGFQKCGTTSLFTLLSQHESVALCRDVKEPMYYRVPLASRIGQGGRYYKRRYFGHIKKNDPRLLGEVNAGLTFSGCAHKLSRNMSRDTKMIFMMRNPVDRSYSAYKYFLARGFLPMDIVVADKKKGHAKAFDLYVHSVLDDRKKRADIMKRRMKYLVLSQSNYGACVGEYLNSFDLKNMHFIIFEEFVSDEQKTCKELYDFLGISDSELIDYHVKSNEGNEQAISAIKAKKFYFVKGLNYFLYDLIAMPHWAPKLYDHFHSYYKRVRKICLMKDPDKSKISSETREYLMEYFEADVRAMEGICGRPLRSIWGYEN